MAPRERKREREREREREIDRERERPRPRDRGLEQLQASSTFAQLIRMKVMKLLWRIAQATAVLTKLKRIWRDNNTSLDLKVKLMRSLVIFKFCMFVSHRP